MVNGGVVKLKYPEVVLDHYRYRRAVDNNNALINYGGIKSQIGLGGAWGTTLWPILFFAFFIACTEVNAYMTTKYFLKKYDIFVNF